MTERIEMLDQYQELAYRTSKKNTDGSDFSQIAWTLLVDCAEAAAALAGITEMIKKNLRHNHRGKVLFTKADVRRATELAVTLKYQAGMLPQLIEMISDSPLDLKSKSAESGKAFANEYQFQAVWAALGLFGEAGELLSAVAQNFILTDNLKKELGDVLWYAADTATALNLNLSEVATSNIAKLQARYGEKFDEAKSLHREESDT